MNENDFTEKQYQEFLNTAKSNLLASKVLCKNKLYAESVSLLQQSVEKAAKAYAIFIKGRSLTEKELRTDIGHEPILLFEDIAEIKKNIYEELKKFINENPQFETAFIAIEFLKEFKIDDVLHLTDSFLSKIRINKSDQKINQMDSVNDDINIKYFNDNYQIYDDNKNMISNFKITNDDLIEIAKQLFRSYELQYYNVGQKKIQIDQKDLKEIENVEKLYEEFDESEIKEVEDQTKIYCEMEITNKFIFNNILYLGIITSPHWEISRYPKADLTLTPKIYTKKLPIVEKLRELLEAQDMTLDKLAILNELNKSYIMITRIIENTLKIKYIEKYK